MTRQATLLLTDISISCDDGKNERRFALNGNRRTKMSYTLLFDWLLGCFALIGLALLVETVITSYRTRWVWRYRDVLPPPKEDERDWLSAFKRSLDTRHD
jgi:hypothetical protein